MLKRLVSIGLLSATVLAFVFIGQASPQTQICDPNDVQYQLQYLRRLSVDFRGYLPSVEEANKVAKEGKVTETLIDSFVESPEFLKELTGYHRDLLWAALPTIRFGNPWRMTGNGDSSPLYIRDRATMFRGRETGNRTVGCLNEPATFDKDGNIQTKTVKGARREGYVKIKPYWAPNTEVKVCAFDAQKALTYKDKSGKEKSCKTDDPRGSKACGCGPNLNWCQSEHHRTAQEFTKAISQQMLFFIEDIVKNNKPYSDMLTAKTFKMNGVFSHYMRHLAHTPDSVRIGAKQGWDKIPNIPFTEKDKWIDVKTSSLHSGMLTMAGFLLRYGTNRGRTNKFYNVFLCRPFQAPPGGLPAGQDPCHKEPNLMKRCGCRYCHQTIEPVAAYWGRWSESAASLMDSKVYPEYLDKCGSRDARRDRFCRTFYFVSPSHQDEERYRGMLKSYVFANDKMKQNIDKGPVGLANEAIKSGLFASCTVKKLWMWFVSKSLPSDHRLKTLTQQFIKDNYNMKKLLRNMVMTSEYRRLAPVKRK